MIRSALMHHPEVNWLDYHGTLTSPGALPNYYRSWYSRCPGASIAMHHFGETYPSGEVWVQHWRELGEMHDRILVVTRPNHLRRYLSTEIAKYIDKIAGEVNPNRNSSQPRTAPPPRLPIDLRRYHHWRDNVIRTTGAITRILRPGLSVTYDQLCSNWSATLRLIYQYFGITWNNPEVRTYKQETRPIEKIIANWDDLSAQSRRLLLEEDSRGL